jgi:hypothetical protein
MSLKKLLLISLALLSLPAAVAFARKSPRYATAISPVPVLNTPDFAKVFSGAIVLDPCKGVRPIEFVALTGTLFKIEGEEQRDGVTVYRVTTNDYRYPSKKGYFIDARFVKPVEGEPQERQRSLPGQAEIQQRLRSAVGKPYVWGGNVKDGLPLLKELYPQADPLAGVDCSGLLYEATNGYTRRNTSALTSYGDAVSVGGLSVDAIAQRLEPLDLIVWKGHVMIVLDHDTIIQSTMGCQGVGGVHLSPLKDALGKLMKTRKPADAFPAGSAGAKGFVVRRWLGEQVQRGSTSRR